MVNGRWPRYARPESSSRFRVRARIARENAAAATEYIRASSAGEPVEPIGVFICRLVLRSLVVHPLLDAALAGELPAHDESRIKSMARARRYARARTRSRYPRHT